MHVFMYALYVLGGLLDMLRLAKYMHACMYVCMHTIYVKGKWSEML